MAPLVEELVPPPEPAELLTKFVRLPHCLFLDSARRHPTLGRYSFLAADPFDYLESPAGQPDALAALAGRMHGWQAPRLADLPPFQGGAAGLLSYDLGRQLEAVPSAQFDEFGIPGLAVGFYDVVVAFDHRENRAWLISHGLPEREPAARRRRAAERLAHFRNVIGSAAGEPGPLRRSNSQTLNAADLAPQFPAKAMAGLTSNLSRDAYLKTVERAIEYVRAGDIFQVNLSQRLLHPAHHDSLSLYLRLRERNPATFASYFDLGAWQIVSASPERFLQVVNGHVEARPIKGTRPRADRPEADLFAGDELQASEKDRAENVMIVDLLRNDLSRVCRPESVRVTQLCEIERYEFVQHLVSAVCGTLAEGRGPIDLVRAAFPGGSITGAPKVRAMQIISELEPTARGAYCGALMYLGFDGTLDSSILIRTITAGAGWWQAPVGGGIVAQSDPRAECEETWHKAEGLIRALK
jgi:para-aminobenzoate synthetase component 1